METKEQKIRLLNLLFGFKIPINKENIEKYRPTNISFSDYIKDNIFKVDLNKDEPEIEYFEMEWIRKDKSEILSDEEFNELFLSYMLHSNPIKRFWIKVSYLHFNFA